MTQTAAQPELNPKQMDERAWWDLWNSSHRIEEHNDPTSDELFERTAAVVNAITQSGAKSVLEIGCGTGTLSRKLTYASYHGLDISPAAIEIARQKAQKFSVPAGSSLPTYDAADFHEWPMPGRLFDVVVCVDAVAYFRDQPFALKKMAGLLQPQGMLVLTTINPFVYNRIRRTSTSPIQEGAVSHWLTRDELHRLIANAGFTIENSFSLMPRGNGGILRVINSNKLNEAFGSRMAATLRRMKEQIGLGQYRLVVAQKKA